MTSSCHLPQPFFIKMSILKRHNPVLERRLQAYLATGDIQGLRSFLEGLSHQDFRTAGFLLGEKLLSELTNSETVFWNSFLVLVSSNSKAYLGTFLPAQAFYLLSAGTLPCYYELFQQLKKVEHDTKLLRTYSVQLMQRGDNLSYNMASILQSYFALGELPGTFSLRLRDYELSRLDGSYELFKKEILKI